MIAQHIVAAPRTPGRVFVAVRLLRARTVSIALPYYAVIAISFAGAESAEAIVAGNVSNLVPNTTVSPAAYPGWTQGDPGWANLALGGTYVYLGDGWVISADSVGYSKDAGITFQTASGPVVYHMAAPRCDGRSL